MAFKKILIKIRLGWQEPCDDAIT